MKGLFSSINGNTALDGIHEAGQNASTIIYIFIGVTILGTAMGIIIVAPTNDHNTTLLLGVNFIPVLISHFLARRGKVESAAAFLAISLIFMNTLISTNTLGIYSINNIAFPVILIIASFVSNRRNMFLLTALTVASLGWLVFGDIGGLYKPDNLVYSAPGSFFSTALVVVVTAYLANWLNASLNKGLLHLRNEIKERRDLSDGLKQREGILETVAFAAEEFLKTPGWRTNIEVVLERLGRTINASHAYLFEDHVNAQGEPVTSMRYEWTAPGFPSHLELDRYQNSLIHQPGFEKSVETLSKGEVRAGNASTFNDIEKEALQSMGVRSIVEVPVFVDGKEWGAIGFDDMENDREWANMEVDALKIAAQVLSAAISREKADSALRESERIYRQAIEAAGAIPYYHDHINNRYLFIGEGIEKILGYKSEEFTPAFWVQNTKEVILRGEGEGLSVREAMRRARSGQMREWRSDVRMLTRNGEERWLANSAIEIFDESEFSHASVGILQDITERKLAEVNLIKHESLLQAVTFAAEQFLKTANWRETINPVLERLGTEFNASHAYLFEKYKNADGEILSSMTYEWTLPGMETDLDNPDFQEVPSHSMGFERMYEILDRGEPLVGSASWLNEFEKQYLRSIGVKALLEIRVIVNGEHWGTIGVDDMTSDREWSPNEVDVLRLASGMLSSAVERSLNNEALENELVERKKLITELENRNSEAETLRETTEIVTSTLNITEAVNQILIQIKRVVKYDSASVWLYEGDTARVVGSHGLSSVALEPGLFKIQSSEPDYPLWEGNLPYVLFADIQEQYPQFRDPPINYIHGWLAVPLKVRGKFTGFISLDGKQVGQFTDHDAILAANYANQVSIALENARLFSDLQSELNERTKLIEELEGKNSELERFTYTVSHDLKSPLVTIAGFLRYLEQDVTSNNMERFKKDMLRIDGAVDKMQRLLLELLELSRIGRMVNPPVEIPFKELVHEAMEAVHGQLESIGCKVTLQPDLPSVCGDLPRLSEVIQNLLDNAAKYMGEQTDPHIEIGMRGMEGDKPILYVKDNGMGIAPEYHNRIFELFHKLDAKSEGTGVGLALVKRIIEIHGGRIWVESAPGKGSIFLFTIPAANNS